MSVLAVSVLSALVLVGHRPSTLSVADKVLFLKEGHVVMFGERDEVLEELKARASECIPEGGDHKWPRRLSPGRSPANGSDHNAKAITGVS